MKLLRKLAATLAVALPFALPFDVGAQTTTACGDGVKLELVKAVEGAGQLTEPEQLRLEAQLYEKYKSCGTIDAAQFPATDPLFTAVRQCGAKIATMGSLFYEEMSCCGYDPQRRTFACPVKIKQRFGFGAAPQPGSREHVLHCVADAAGVLQPVGSDSVHLANSTLAPTWQFAVVANATDRLALVQPLAGQARRARSILSWQLRPTGCNYQPIWGIAIDYAIRLDP